MAFQTGGIIAGQKQPFQRGGKLAELSSGSIIKPDTLDNVKQRADEEFNYAADNSLPLDVAAWDRELFRANKNLNDAYGADPSELNVSPSLAIAEIVSASDRKPNPYKEGTYEYSIYEKGPVTSGEQFAKEWFTKRGLATKTPIFGGLIGAKYAAQAKLAFERQKSRVYPDKQKLPDDFQDWTTIEQNLFLDKQIDTPTPERDLKLIESYFEYMYESEIRGVTDGAQIVGGVSVLPTYMIEFLSTGGIAKLGSEPAKYAATKLMSKYAVNKGIRHAVTKGAGVVAGGVARGTIGLAPRTLEDIAVTRTGISFGMREDESLTATVAKAWGNQVIEAISEESGALIEKPLKAVGKKALKKMPFVKKMFDRYKQLRPTGTYMQFVDSFFTKSGWNGLIGEYGEERIGTIMRGITGADDYGVDDDNPLTRTYEMLKQDLKQAKIEIPVLLFPAGAKSIAGVGGTALNLASEKRISEEARRILAEEGRFVETEAEKAAGKPVGAEKGKESGETVAKEEKAAEIEPQESTDRPIETPKPEPVKRPEPVPEPPSEIAEANTSQEVNIAINKILDYTGPRQRNIERDAEALGLSGVASKTRVTRLEQYQRAKNERIPEEAHRIAAEVNANPRPLAPHESAGLTIALVKLKNEYAEKHRQFLAAETEQQRKDADARKADIETEFESLYSAIFKSGSERGRALASQRYALDKDFSFISIQNEAKIKKGDALTDKEKKKFSRMSEALAKAEAEIERLNGVISENVRTQTIKIGSIARYSGMAIEQKKAELSTLVEKTRKLLSEGCY